MKVRPRKIGSKLYKLRSCEICARSKKHTDERRFETFHFRIYGRLYSTSQLFLRCSYDGQIPETKHPWFAGCVCRVYACWRVCPKFLESKIHSFYTYLVMKMCLQDIRIFFSLNTCSCCWVSTMCCFFKHSRMLFLQ